MKTRENIEAQKNREKHEKTEENRGKPRKIVENRKNKGKQEKTHENRRNGREQQVKTRGNT